METGSHNMGYFGGGRHWVGGKQGIPPLWLANRATEGPGIREEGGRPRSSVKKKGYRKGTVWPAFVILISDSSPTTPGLPLLGQ